jgi:A/G-specific adenine glycosylase
LVPHGSPSPPWRQKPTLYKTVVSEFMLQQTQVKTVLPYFARWMSELPDFPSLAAATPGRVLKLWEGLGYYSRARNLHRLAQALVDLPETPRSPEDWLPLPGVGPYTAAAITSMAFGASTACVDGNVVRILARLTADGAEYQDSATAARAFVALANSLLPEGSAGDHNQAMMELGATVCFRRSPLCVICPVRPFCASANNGNPEAYPRLSPKRIEQRTVCRVWCERKGKLLLHRAAPHARRLAGQHELPTAEQTGIGLAAAQRGKLFSKKKRGITRFQITESIHKAVPPRTPAPDLVWVPLAQLDSITLSGPHRRWVNEILKLSNRH